MSDHDDTPRAVPSRYADGADPGERDETPGERLDRQWNELLQELRVTQTGLQLLSGFLLTLPFQNRFADLSPTLLTVFLVAVSTAALATALVVGPVGVDRHLVQGHRKDTIVAAGHVMAKIGLGLLAATIVAVSWLTFGFVLGPEWGLVGAGAAVVVFLGLWIILPLSLRSRRDA